MDGVSRIIDDGEGTSKTLWRSFLKDSYIAIQSPFWVAMVAGRLTDGDFFKFLSQQSRLLKCFEESLRRASESVIREEDLDEADKIAITLLIGDLHFNASILTQYPGIERGLRFPENPQTSSFKEFVRDTSGGFVHGDILEPFNVFAYTLGVMVGHIHFLTLLWKETMKTFEDTGVDPPFEYYMKFFENDILKVSTLGESLLDKISKALSANDKNALTRIYAHSILYEHEIMLSLTPVNSFFPLVKEHDPVEKPIILFTSFLSTCTLSVEEPLFRFEYEAEAEAEADAEEILYYWGLRSREESDLYHGLIDGLINNHPRVEYYDYRLLKQGLKQLSIEEKVINTSLIGFGFFDDLMLDDVNVDGALNMMAGCIDFFQSVTGRENMNVHVLSRCWCSELIRSTFHSSGVYNLDIHCNEMKYERFASTVERKVETGMDKMNAFVSIVQKSNYLNMKGLTVYIGSGVADLLCLLKADVGIVIGLDTRLRELGRRFGVSFIPLFNALVGIQKQFVDCNCSWYGGMPGTLYTVSCWEEIKNFVVGYAE